MRLHVAIILMAACILGTVSQRHMQHKRKDDSQNCVSKFYNRELGPLEILMLPLGEKLWLRAWLGNHMTNLLHMEGVDLAEVTQLATENNRTKRSSLNNRDNENIQYDSNLPSYIIPNSYRLMLQPFPQEYLFQGRVLINVTCLEAANKIVLHADKELQVSRTALSVRKMGTITSAATNSFQQRNHYERFPENYLQVIKVIRDMKKSQCEILLSESLMKGVTYQLDIQFSGHLSSNNQQAFYHSVEENSTSEMRWFMATRLKYGNARRVFPCFDEPRFKATFEISIARPVDMKAISTMPVRTSEPIAEQRGWKWDHFQITPPMSSSSLIIFIFNPRNMFPVLPTVIQGGVNVQGFAQAADLSKAQAMVDYLVLGISYLERYLGVAFPLPQLNVVFLPDISAPAEDYWGFLMVGNNIRSSFHFVRQWFGHLVTPKQWAYENITTSLAQYHAYICPLEIIERCELTESPAWGLRYSHTTQYDINDQPSTDEFQMHKMVWFFRMLNFTLTERSFRRGIQNFLKKRAYSTFIEDDLWNTLDMQAWSYGSLDRNISTEHIARSWFSKDHFPVITVARNYHNNTASIEQQVFVRRWPYAIPGQEDMLWWIPIMYLTKENLDVHNISTITWMREERHISIDNLPGPDSFIVVNPDDIGMFIVNYDTTNWNMLSEYLLASGSGDGQPLIPPATRAKLLHNAWYLALGGRVDFATALNVTLFLNSEKEVSVWKALAQVYFTVSWKLIGMDAEAKFDRFIGELLIPMYEAAEEEDPQEYQVVAEIHALARYVLCKAGHKVAIDRARVEYAKWLEDQMEISDGTLWGIFRWVDEDWERGVERVLDLLHNETAPGFRAFLLEQLVSNTIQPHKVERILSMLLIEENYTFSDAELKKVSEAITDSRTFLKFITNHWIVIKTRFKNKVGIWQYLLEQATKKFKTQEGYDMVLEFYKTYKDKLGDATSIVQHSLQVIRVNKEGTYKNLPELETWMDHYLEFSETNHLFYSA